MRSLDMVGRGLLAALRVQMRRQFAKMATVAAGFGLIIFGAALVAVGAIFALAQQIGPIAAFCGSGAVFVLVGFVAVQAVRPSGLAALPEVAPIPPDPVPPSSEMPTAAAVVFVLGFMAIRALMRAKGGGQD